MAQFYERVYELVRTIPAGRVTTYGTVARLLGEPRAARAVGYAMRALPPGTDVPWHRVVNAHGTISTKAREVPEIDLQRHLLEAEGVTFDAEDRLDFDRCGWGDPLGRAKSKNTRIRSEAWKSPP